MLKSLQQTVMDKVASVHKHTCWASRCFSEITLSYVTANNNPEEPEPHKAHHSYSCHFCIGCHVAIGNCDRWLMGLRLWRRSLEQSALSRLGIPPKKQFKEILERGIEAISLLISSLPYIPSLYLSSSSSSSPSAAVSLDAHSSSVHKKASDIILLARDKTHSFFTFFNLKLFSQ